MLSRIKNRLKREANSLNNWIWFYTIKGFRNRAKLKKLKNSFEGKRCFILGNGPSLLQCDLSLLENEITIASNRNYLIWEKMGFIPTFFTVEDALVANNWSDEINSLQNTFKIFPRDLSDDLQLSNDNGVYVKFIRDQTVFPSFSLDVSSKAFWGGTVSVFNLQLAYFLGFKEIYLIGLDHSYTVKQSGDSIKLNSEQLNSDNYIHPSYMEKGKLMYSPNVERMEMGYVKANEILKQNNVKVFNATVGGNLEVFDRVDYSKLFDKPE